MESAERLWKRIERAQDAHDLSLAKKLGRKLAAVDERVEAARGRITEHTRATMRKPMEKRSKPARLLRARVSRVAG